jgi:peptide deformylase
MIVTVPNSVLTSPAKKVEKIDKKILSIVSKMKKDLIDANKPKGVGLAAPQIGVPLRIFITRPTEKSPIRVFMNPEILARSETVSEIVREDDGKPNVRREKKLEGCLSIPNVWGHLKRATWVKLKYMDEHGEEKVETFQGFLATIVQHETDHLNGVLFTQRVIEQKEKLYSIETNINGEEQWEEIAV